VTPADPKGLLGGPGSSSDGSSVPPSAANPSAGPGSNPRPTVRIGITGPIGCGKSTVAGWLGELGAGVIDADQVARQVTGPGERAVAEIAAAFGADLVRPDGSLDRAALGRIVFSDAAALAALEAIVHPAVRPVILAEMAAAERAGAPAVVVEAIKLVEGGLADLCDEVWLIVCSTNVQMARLRARIVDAGGDPADAGARIDAQSGLIARLAPLATRVLDTSGSVADTRADVEAAYAQALASRAPSSPAAHAAPPEG
jgi:dephospho-CoA kinase